MLTVLRCFVPKIKDIHYSIMVEYCMAQARHYSTKKNTKKTLYWCEKTSKYLMKQFELFTRKRV